MERTGQNQRRHVCFVQIARWRYRGRSLLLNLLIADVEAHQVSIGYLSIIYCGDGLVYKL